MASKLLLVNSRMQLNATGWVMAVSICYKSERLSSEKICNYLVHSELDPLYARGLSERIQTVCQNNFSQTCSCGSVVRALR